MNGRTPKRGAVAAALVAAIVLVGCENLPGTAKTQGAVVGGVTGALVGAETLEGTIGTLIGAALGAAAGYLIGANVDHLVGGGEQSQAEAVAAAELAQNNPVTVADVAPGGDADLNNDGFVTSDELIALENAGLSDEEILSRLQATKQVFVLSRQQKQRLVSAGISPEVVYQLEEINQGLRQRVIGARTA